MKKTINILLLILFFTQIVFAENKLEITPKLDKEECIFNRIKLNLYTNETLALTRIRLKINNPDIILNNNFYDNENYFEDNNKFRIWNNLVEFFDLEPKYSNGTITLEFLNESDDYNEIKPGKYSLEFYPFLQKRNDEIIKINPYNLTYIMSSLASQFNATTKDRLNLTNTAVMGEELTLELNATEGYWFDNIDYEVYYDNEVFDNGEIQINKNTTNQIFFEKIDTITEDLQDEFVCPRDDLKIILSDQCSEKEIKVKQIPPKPSDIYYQVERYFNNNEKIRIVRIYYMAGAYFNCLDERAEESFD